MPAHFKPRKSGDTFYVVLMSRAGEALIASSDERSLLEDQVARTVSATHSKVHAYVWTRNDLRVVVEVESGGIGKFESKFRGGYTQAINSARGRSGPLFAAEIRHVRILLPEDFRLVVQRVHGVGIGGIRNGKAKGCSSEAYWGTKRPRWLTMDRYLDTLAMERGAPEGALEQEDRQLREALGAKDRSAKKALLAYEPGDPIFLRWLRTHVRHRAPGI